MAGVDTILLRVRPTHNYLSRYSAMEDADSVGLSLSHDLRPLRAWLFQKTHRSEAPQPLLSLLVSSDSQSVPVVDVILVVFRDARVVTHVRKRSSARIIQTLQKPVL